mmetsp:Transcript_112489/g.314345  ORF Transcript_112489/g.314345 Transcript_112489/m.314345 type:complete len:167 (+) Transcript_112489:62-562(+)
MMTVAGRKLLYILAQATVLATIAVVFLAMRLTAIGLFIVAIAFLPILTTVAARAGARLASWRSSRGGLRTKQSIREEIERRCPARAYGTEPSTQQEMCAICMETKGESDSCRILCCSHSFHVPCIDGWWLTDASRLLECPLCRRVEPEMEVGVVKRILSGVTGRPR